MQPVALAGFFKQRGLTVKAEQARRETRRKRVVNIRYFIVSIGLAHGLFLPRQAACGNQILKRLLISC